MRRAEIFDVYLLIIAGIVGLCHENLGEACHAHDVRAVTGDWTRVGYIYR